MGKLTLKEIFLSKIKKFEMDKKIFPKKSIIELYPPLTEIEGMPPSITYITVKHKKLLDSSEKVKVYGIQGSNEDDVKLGYHLLKKYLKDQGKLELMLYPKVPVKCEANEEEYIKRKKDYMREYGRKYYLKKKALAKMAEVTMMRKQPGGVEALHAELLRCPYV